MPIGATAVVVIGIELLQLVEQTQQPLREMSIVPCVRYQYHSFLVFQENVAHTRRTRPHWTWKKPAISSPPAESTREALTRFGPDLRNIGTQRKTGSRVRLLNRGLRNRATLGIGSYFECVIATGLRKGRRK